MNSRFRHIQAFDPESRICPTQDVSLNSVSCQLSATVGILLNVLYDILCNLKLKIVILNFYMAVLKQKETR